MREGRSDPSQLATMRKMEAGLAKLDQLLRTSLETQVHSPLYEGTPVHLPG